MAPFSLHSGKHRRSGLPKVSSAGLVVWEHWYFDIVGALFALAPGRKLATAEMK